MERGMQIRRLQYFLTSLSSQENCYIFMLNTWIHKTGEAPKPRILKHYKAGLQNYCNSLRNTQYELHWWPVYSELLTCLTEERLYRVFSQSVRWYTLIFPNKGDLESVSGAQPGNTPFIGLETSALSSTESNHINHENYVKKKQVYSKGIMHV